MPEFPFGVISNCRSGLDYMTSPRWVYSQTVQCCSIISWLLQSCSFNRHVSEACEWTNNVKQGYFTQPSFRHLTSELALGVSASLKDSRAILKHMCALTHLVKTPLTGSFIWTFHAREVEFQLHFGLKVCSVCHSCRNCFHNSGPSAKSSLACTR